VLKFAELFAKLVQKSQLAWHQYNAKEKTLYCLVAQNNKVGLLVRCTPPPPPAPPPHATTASHNSPPPLPDRPTNEQGTYDKSQDYTLRCYKLSGDRRNDVMFEVQAPTSHFFFFSSPCPLCRPPPPSDRCVIGCVN
jgi:hypothetical protein